jgi:zinc D-Ala-D-Ala carboxypeptidase
MEKISKNISYREATKSATASRRGIENKATDFQLSNMKMVADKIFQPVREHFGKPIAVTSFLRSLELNKAIGGSKTSQHLQGGENGKIEGAIDMDADVYQNGIRNSKIFDFIKENLEFDQLIWEYGNNNEPDWVHASYRHEANRKQVLQAKRVNGKTKYVIYEG